MSILEKELYSGSAESIVETEDITSFYKNNFIEVPQEHDEDGNIYLPYFPWEAVTLNNEDETQSCIGIFNPHNFRIEALSKKAQGPVAKITGKNREQRFALELLLNPNIPLVTLLGKAGTGKTLLASAAAIESVVNCGDYNKIMIARPIYPMGKDLGFLPGDVDAKLFPWMQPIFDNMDLIFSAKEEKYKPKEWRPVHQELMERGLLEMEPLTYIRGRSISKTFMLVDEAQNLTPNEIKTIVTRVGEGTKLVFTGDIEQIDNPHLDYSTNGLTYLIEKFKDDPLSAHLTLFKGERSLLAERAAQIL